MKTYPGSTIPVTELTGKQFLDNLFIATNGIVMSQLSDLISVRTPTIQNWFQRGFVTRPVNKRYSKDQVARILIINMLRNTTSLDNVSTILYYINGKTESTSDDIINESELYGYICDIVLNDEFNKNSAEELIQKALKDYKEAFKGAKERLSKAITVICLYLLADEILNLANDSFGSLSKTPGCN